MKNLPWLIEIDAETSENISDISGMSGLPELKVFKCKYCKIDNISSLAKFSRLEHVTMGVEVDNLNDLVELSNLKTLKVISESLTQADAIGLLDSLQSIDLKNTLIKKLTLTKELPNLEEIRLSDVPLDVMPDLSKTPNIKSFTVLGSNINQKVLDLGYLPQVERLNFSNIKFTELRNLDNYPNLKELSLYDAQLTTLEPLLDVPNLSILNLNQSSKDIPNASAVISALIKANTSFTSRKRDKKTAREVYEQILATKPEPVSNSGRRSRN